MRKFLIAVLGSLVFLMVFATEISVDYNTDELIRFHVIANSDSVEDQELKYQVKDQVVQYMAEEFADSQDISESRQILLADMDEIQAIAQQTVAAQGYDYPVGIQYGHFDFPIKYYGNFSLPAGNYEAVRLVIGEGQGQNWWCVLFPPMCFVDQSEAGLDKYSNNEPQKEIIIRWRIVEWFEKLFNKTE